MAGPAHPVGKQHGEIHVATASNAVAAMLSSLESPGLYHVPWYAGLMDARLTRLLDLLDADGGETVGTSIRIPTALRDAAVVATDLGLAPSTTDLTVRGLRGALEAFAQRAVLDAHYEEYPEARPDLAEIALATAEMEGNPLADSPELIRRAAEGVRRILEDPRPDDVLVYAAGLAAAAA